MSQRDVHYGRRLKEDEASKHALPPISLPPVTDELITYMRQHGASDDLLEFADRHVARFSQVDLERARTRAFWLGVLVATGILTVARLVS